MSLFKDLIAPVLGGGAGFLLGGPAGAGLGAGLGLSFSGQKAQTDAAERATQAQVSAGDRATQAQLEMFYKNRADLAPYREEGYEALGKQSGVAGQYANVLANPNLYTQSPSFNFNLQQGVNALDRSAASRGKLDSGEHLKDLLSFGTGLASQDYNNYLNRLLNLSNIYGGIAGTGQAATQTGASLGQNLAGNLANIYQGQGNAIASGQINQANAKTGLYSNLSNIGSSAIDQYMLSQVLGMGGGSSGGFLPDVPNYSYIPRTSLNNPYGAGFGG